MLSGFNAISNRRFCTPDRDSERYALRAAMGTATRHGRTRSAAAAASWRFPGAAGPTRADRRTRPRIQYPPAVRVAKISDARCESSVDAATFHTPRGSRAPAPGAFGERYRYYLLHPPAAIGYRPTRLLTGGPVRFSADSPRLRQPVYHRVDAPLNCNPKLRDETVRDR
ncbi:Hypothetical protein CINCED_3A006230 [Cinara cedri]|uniref:Uncharacterized protein n=1 Tax=Cinara cedri TaxID=506608 RepID=A0A5E4NEM8_9HEMI|nr:Hypothetical protein CINCED_3A006230 [Cinara cedri]